MHMFATCFLTSSCQSGAVIEALVVTVSTTPFDTVDTPLNHIPFGDSWSYGLLEVMGRESPCYVQNDDLVAQKIMGYGRLCIIYI